MHRLGYLRTLEEDREALARIHRAAHHVAMHLGAQPIGRGAIAEAVPLDTPVLILEIDAAAVAEPSAPAQRCSVRLIPSSGNGVRREHRPSRNGEVSAVVVLRALTLSRLRSCVRAVTSGDASIPPEVFCQMLSDRGSTRGADTSPPLTPREFDVLRLLGDGETTRSIAQRLSYSERTVKKIVHDLLEKLQCRTRAQAVAIAARRGVI